MAEAERLLEEHGHDQAALAVTLDNHDAARLYKRLGYEYWAHGVIQCDTGDEYGTFEPCYVMVKSLVDSSASDRAWPAPSARRTGVA
jgi:ribosomal protein S18 acetylase RimI-like enzyme